MKIQLKLYLLLLLFVISACNGQDSKKLADNKKEESKECKRGDRDIPPPFTFPTPKIEDQISPFVRRIFQDKNEHMWFGTNGDGVIRYNGERLDYFGQKQGFAGVAVRRIVEDKEGNVWFATNMGISKYNPDDLQSGGVVTFTNYTMEEGLIHNDVWSMTVDSKGILWIGTKGGVCYFDGKTFTPFQIPDSVEDPTRGVTSKKIVHDIIEDSNGYLWFTSNGGAYQWDGKELMNLNTVDGLSHNFVNSIAEDDNGNYWFATHHNGVCMWDKQKFTQFDEKDGIKYKETWTIYKDSKNNIWFPVEGSGIYKYNGKEFVNYSEEHGLGSVAMQSIYEDKSGTIWVGGYMGLYRFNGEYFENLKKDGNW